MYCLWASDIVSAFLIGAMPNQMLFIVAYQKSSEKKKYKTKRKKLWIKRAVDKIEIWYIYSGNKRRDREQKQNDNKKMSICATLCQC